MLFFELAWIIIIVFYVILHAIKKPVWKHFLLRIGLVSAAAWMAEESCIFLYKFYDYSSNWKFFLYHVPLLVIAAWPVVIHSAWDLSSQILGSGHRLVPLSAGGIVLTDAVLIEIVAVHCGLWWWNEPGIFDVPAIGILGWAFFAFLCILLFEAGERRNTTKRFNLLLLTLPVIVTHLLLLIIWWGGLRWVNIPVGPRFAVMFVWGLSFFLVYAILRNKTGIRMEKKTLLLRLPAALCIYTLLSLNIGSSALLIVSAADFALPYITLLTSNIWFSFQQ